MSIFKKLFGKNSQPTPQPKRVDNTLFEDIQQASDWAVNNLNKAGYVADYSLESMKEVDRFFDTESQPGRLLARHENGYILFALGSYLGQTAIRLYGGQWVTDDKDPKGEINASVHLADGAIIWPIIRCMNRLENGQEDSLSAYLLLQDPARKN